MPILPGAKPNVVFYAEVEPFDTLRMVDRVMDVLSGPNLERFLMADAFNHFQDEIVQRFANQGDKKSGHWADLSEATQNIRAHDGFGPDWPVNVRTNEMFETVAENADYWFGAHSAEMMMPGSASTGSVAEKIRTAQQGKSTNSMSSNFGPTPPRPVLAVDESDLEELLVRLTRFIVAGVVGSLA